MTTSTNSQTRKGFPRLDELDPSDWVLLRMLIALVMLGGAVTMVAAVFANAFSGIEFATKDSVAGPEVSAGMPAGDAVARYTDDIVWTIASPTVLQRILVALPQFAAGALVLLAAAFLYALVQQLRTGDFFGGASLRALKGLALTLTIGGMLWPFLRLGCEFALNASLRSQPDFLFGLNAIEFTPFVVGLLLVALLGVFRKGAQLAEDADGLI